MDIIAVYVIGDHVTKQFYIGSTRNLKRRTQEHKYDLKANKHHNSRLQELYNSNAALKIYHITTDTIEEARKLEDDMLKKMKDNPKLLNYSIDSSGGNGILRHPNKENIIKNITKNRKKHWDSLSKEEKETRFLKTKNASNTLSAIAKRKHSFQKYIMKTPIDQRRPSKETIEKRRLSLIGQKRSQKTKDKMRQAQLGKTHTDETKLKMSQITLARIAKFGPYKHTEETKEQIRISQLGKRHTEETKKKLSEITRLRQASRTTEQRKHTEATKLKLSLRHKGKIITPEQRKKMSESKKQFLNSMTPEKLQIYRTRLYGSRTKTKPDL